MDTWAYYGDRPVLTFVFYPEWPTVFFNNPLFFPSRRIMDIVRACHAITSLNLNFRVEKFFGRLGRLAWRFEIPIATIFC